MKNQRLEWAYDVMLPWLFNVLVDGGKREVNVWVNTSGWFQCDEKEVTGE